MDAVKKLLTAMPDLIGAVVAIAVVVAVLWAANWVLLRRRPDLGEGRRFPRRIIMGLLVVLGAVAVLLALPVEEETRHDLITLIGVIVTAAIALSSTTFVANVMAGLMLRAVRSFRSGDFIRVGEHFGRVTERGLFHTEIQTEDRDLTTLPNLYLVANPLKVVRYSGTIISAHVSLGYDVPQQQVRPLLLAAAEAAGLQKPFIQITDLGDFAVTYRVAGLLPEVTQLIAMRSTLRSQVLDALHNAGVEIVSPAFMTQRQLQGRARVLPDQESAAESVSEPHEMPDDVIFDKAEEAGRREQLALEQEALSGRIAALQSELKTVDEVKQGRLQRELERCRTQSDEIAAELRASDSSG
jgi:small conductance mechanosensitive channel